MENNTERSLRERSLREQITYETNWETLTTDAERFEWCCIQVKKRRILSSRPARWALLALGSRAGIRDVEKKLPKAIGGRK